MSGSSTSRPQLDACLDYLRAGDVLVVWRLDRLGRSTRHVLEVLDQLERRNIGFQSLTEAVDTTGAMGKAMLTILAAFAELERNVIIERTRAGLDAARAKGRVGGRPRALNAQQLKTAQALHDSGTHTITEIAGMLGVARATLYRALKTVDVPS